MGRKFTIILMLFALRAFVVNAQEISGANIILNPSFDTDDTGWGHYFDYFWDPTNALAAKASLSVEPKDGFTGNVYKVSIQDAGTANYSVQISYPMALETGKKYSIKFKASADAPRTVAINLQQDISPKTSWYTSSAIDLTTTPATYGPYYYTATDTDASNLFKFYLGGGGTTNAISTYFDDIEVEEIITVSETLGANIILNSSFDADDAGWGHYFDYFWDPTNALAAKASLSVEPKDGFTGNVYKVAIQNAGTADYSVQISYPMALEAGKKYSLKFKASADAPRTVFINLQQNVSPKTSWYTSSAVNLTTTPSSYGPYYYTATDTDASNLFKFYLGGGGSSNGVSAYFDDIEVAEIIPGTGVSIPDAPTDVAAVAGSSKATVSFKTPANTGGLNIKYYTVISTPGNIKATGTASPIKVTGLVNGTTYTFTASATNALGQSNQSVPSNVVTPVFLPNVYYVSSISGNDNNDGLNKNSAFATLGKVHSTMIPGDTALIMSGTYSPLTIKTSGTAEGVITYKAYAGDNPVVTCGLAGDWNLLQISASYITIDGIEFKGINDLLTLAQGEANYDKILAALDAGTSPDYQSTTNTNTNGVSIGDSKIEVVHHVTLKNCKIHDCSAGGAGATNADYVTIENNDIYNNSWYTMWATSGISVIYLIGTDDGANVVIRGNKVHNNYTLVKWISIKKYSDGNGIIIDVQHPEGSYPGYTGKLLVENNLVYDNGGRGLYIMAAQNALFRNNTSFWNSKKSYSDGGEMVVYDSHDVTFVNNIGWANPAYSTGNYGIRDDGNWGTNSNITWKNNLAFNGTIGSPSIYLNKTTTTSVENSNKLGVNPLFVNATIETSNADFHLRTGSPAINSGTSTLGVSTFDIANGPRVQDQKVDIGAYESVVSITEINHGIRHNQEIVVYPNPTSGQFQILYTNEGDADVRIYNMFGQTILHFERTGNIDESINISNYPQGLYYVKIHNSAGTKIKRLLLHHNR